MQHALEADHIAAVATIASSLTAKVDGKSMSYLLVVDRTISLHVTVNIIREGIAKPMVSNF